MGIQCKQLLRIPIKLTIICRSMNHKTKAAAAAVTPHKYQNSLSHLSPKLHQFFQREDTLCASLNERTNQVLGIGSSQVYRNCYNMPQKSSTSSIIDIHAPTQSHPCYFRSGVTHIFNLPKSNLSISQTAASTVSLRGCTKVLIKPQRGRTQNKIIRWNLLTMSRTIKSKSKRDNSES